MGIRSIKSDAGDSTVSRLVDEQVLVENPPTYRSETYFDEDLFVRAAKQYLSLNEPVSEETHPPLGKLIIAAGLDAFGFNPFSWRIMGVIFATLMIPVIYTLGLALFKTRAAATIAASLLSLDFMHFTMSRMGTADTYLVFFILLSTLFFYLSYEKMVSGSGPDYRFILLGVACFGLAFSVKWIALFGFMGEAISVPWGMVHRPLPLGWHPRPSALTHQASRAHRHHDRGRRRWHLPRLIHTLRPHRSQPRRHLQRTVVDARLPQRDGGVHPP